MLVGLRSPVRDQDTAPFWEACDDGRLQLQRCNDCHTVRWPPGPSCPNCLSQRHAWEASAGKGVVFSWVVVHVALDEALVDQVPYTVGVIQLEEGVRMVSTIDGCDSAAIRDGMPVEVRFEHAADGRGLPTFVPAAEVAA